MTDFDAVQARLNSDPDYRSAFFGDPAGTLRAAGIVVSAEKERALAAFVRQARTKAARDTVTRSKAKREPHSEISCRPDGEC